MEFDTQAIRAGHTITHEQEHAEPMFLTSSYRFNSAKEAADRFSGEDPGNVYSRYTNPTVATFEKRLAELEGAEDCVATASGMSAILTLMMAHLEQGDHIVSSRSIFGTSFVLFETYLAKMGISTTFVDLLNLDAWQAAISPKTKIFFLETPSNPLNEVADLQALADLAHDHNAWLVVDNCFCTPALQQPLRFGADFVTHSATKYLDGQGRCVGGAVLGSAELIEPVRKLLRTAGPTMSAFNAWVFLKGLETLSLRMKAHCDNALALAKWLQAQKRVAKVHYAGLPEHPGHVLAQKQQRGFSGVLAFEVIPKSGQSEQEAAWEVIDQTKLLSITANLGDTKTTIVHPATTTHARMGEERRAEVGVRDNLVRISVGLESLMDIQKDLACLAQLS